jgi:hypothetical protein
MTPELHALHIAASLRAGRAVECDKKVAYGSEAHAASAADVMNKERSSPYTMGAYPCAFCEKWHVGRKMTEAELHSAAYALMSADELAGIPTSLLLRDVIAHGCDRLDRDRLCDRCSSKWAEVDRRFPTRMVKP